jgi:hypothetical protein
MLSQELLPIEDTACRDMRIVTDELFSALMAVLVARLDIVHAFKTGKANRMRRAGY